MNTGAIFLARFSQVAQLMPALDQLQTMGKHLEWEALDGHMQLVIRTKDAERVESTLTNIDGLESVVRCDVTKEEGAWPGVLAEDARVWFCIETEPERQVEVAEALSRVAGLRYLAHTSGACDLIGIIESATLSQLEKIIAAQVRPLDGIVRLKHDRVISLTQL